MPENTAPTIRPLTPALEKVARDELGEDPNRVNEDVKVIQDWIAKQPHLIARTDEQWIVQFLRGCKFSLERTKAKLELYYTLRSTAADLTRRLKPSDPKFKEILDLGPVLILPKTAGSLAPRVSIIRPAVCDPEKYHILDVMSVSYTIHKILIYEDDVAIVNGGASVLDLDNVSMGHFTQMTPNVMKKMIAMGQDAMPFRIKGAHYLNTPSGFETIFNFMKPLLNKKNQQRLYVHNKDYDALYERVPKDILPAEYGGSGGTVQEIIDSWKKKIDEYSSWLEEDEKYGTDEKRRVGAPKTSENMFGVEGSFRQLQID